MYVYFRERRLKYDIVWNDNGTVTYRQNRTFHFVPDMSFGSEEDMFYAPNPVYWVCNGYITVLG